jgi:hypothetical protein
MRSECLPTSQEQLDTSKRQQANARDTIVPLIFLNVLIIVWAIAFG